MTDAEFTQLVERAGEARARIGTPSEDYGARNPSVNFDRRAVELYERVREVLGR